MLLALCTTAAADAEGDKKDLAGFAYEETTANAGSKSAGSRGSLSFAGRPLLGYSFRQIRTPIGSFFYIESDRLWEPQGWFRIADIAVKSVDAMIPAAALAAGTYQGPRRVGTPGDWCYDLQRDAWFDPVQLTR